MVLSDGEGNQLLVPEGFAHGFCTLEPDCTVLYKVNRYYSPENDRGLLWNDPALGIDWRLGGREPVLSDKDYADVKWNLDMLLNPRALA